jgi:hypothetical protein
MIDLLVNSVDSYKPILHWYDFIMKHKAICSGYRNPASWTGWAFLSISSLSLPLRKIYPLARVQML